MGNLGSVLSGAASGAAAGGSIGGIYGYLGGGILGAASGAFSDTSSLNSANVMSMHDLYNLEMYNTMKDLYFMNQQDNYNRGTMRYQTDLQHELNKQAFDYNNYFIDNAYQKSVNSMRAAGLNPLLLAGNSPSVGSASAGSSSALGIQQGSHGIDPANMLSASANSAQAKIAKSQLALNAANTVSDIAMKRSSSALQSEQAKSESNRRRNIDADTTLKGLQGVRQSIENSNLDDKMKAEIKKDLATAESSMIIAKVQDYLKESQAYANITGAKAAYINATEGNATKVITSLIRGIVGDDPEIGGKHVYDYVKDTIKKEHDRVTTKPTKENDYTLSDYDKKVLQGLYDSLHLKDLGVPLNSK